MRCSSTIMIFSCIAALVTAMAQRDRERRGYHYQLESPSYPTHHPSRGPQPRSSYDHASPPHYQVSPPHPSTNPYRGDTPGREHHESRAATNLQPYRQPPTAQPSSSDHRQRLSAQPTANQPY